jgi:hypothetical protein
MTPDVAEIPFRQHRTERLDGGFEEPRFPIVNWRAEFALDAAVAVAQVEIATEPRIEHRAVNENFTNGDN